MLIGEEVTEAQIEVGAGIGRVVVVGGWGDVGYELTAVCS